MASRLEEPENEPTQRPSTSYSNLAELSAPFHIDPAQRSYRHQYSNIYFVRLVELRPIVERNAQARWGGVRGKPPLLPRILNLQKGQLCYIVGTVYLEMPLKPNVLEDMARDHWIAPPAPRAKFFSGQDAVHLEDESGRVRLVGEVIRRERDRENGGLVTGIIMAALGMETSAGDFEVIDLCFAGLPELYTPQAGPSNGGSHTKGKSKADANGQGDTDHRNETWIAIVSGLSVGSQEAPADLKSQLLVEWLLGEDGGPLDGEAGDRIARLILAGNSLSQPIRGEDDKKPKRFNSTAKPLYTNHPTKTLSVLLNDLLSSSLPVTMVPGPSDPAGATLPQQPLPKVMFGGKKAGGLDCTTNPTWLEIGGRSLLVTGGQTLDDIYKYVPSEGRLGMAQRTLEWRHVAPTAPDTLWVYPFPDADPFIIHKRPELYIIGNQPEFQTTVVGDDSPTRIILVPSFAKTGQIVVCCLETLETKTIGFEVPDWEGETKTNGDLEVDVKME
ncbi:DNA polymerase alpha/epsilon subunit B-domain-containing protein [Kockovaella imperatae]|uniref:DNA-directed DNA polymerase n=1 Tax=Kockovaella imperatae TaxID=4999 RepID=A0A1Y1UQ99_9TREE|nr:DNA polymerase alpha/epsilon subunit B-domain-containing protein [Kockovaella imperatae]ORX39674.1 DNA polymerase alpha/epsilon subunit B-domain-containing protein [Kockovaella imperatae]